MEQRPYKKAVATQRVKIFKLLWKSEFRFLFEKVRNWSVWGPNESSPHSTIAFLKTHFRAFLLCLAPKYFPSVRIFHQNPLCIPPPFFIYVHTHVQAHTSLYTECNGRNLPHFMRTFVSLIYTDLTHTYIRN